jgi:hypothetical protein
MPTHLPIYYNRNPHFRHDVVCSRVDQPFDLRLPWAAFETSRRRNLQKFYKIFQRLHDCKNFSETSERSRQPGHIGFSPVFPAYPAPPPTPSIFHSRMQPAPGPAVSSRRTLDTSRCTCSWDRSSSPKSAENLNGAACWWLLGAVIAPITWSTSRIQGRGARAKFRRCRRFSGRLCHEAATPQKSIGRVIMLPASQI